MDWWSPERRQSDQRVQAGRQPKQKIIFEFPSASLLLRQHLPIRASIWFSFCCSPHNPSYSLPPPPPSSSYYSLSLLSPLLHFFHFLLPPLFLFLTRRIVPLLLLLLFLLSRQSFHFYSSLIVSPSTCYIFFHYSMHFSFSFPCTFVFFLSFCSSLQCSGPSYLLFPPYFISSYSAFTFRHPALSYRGSLLSLPFLFSICSHFPFLIFLPKFPYITSIQRARWYRSKALDLDSPSAPFESRLGHRLPRM